MGRYKGREEEKELNSYWKALKRRKVTGTSKSEHQIATSWRTRSGRGYGAVARPLDDYDDDVRPNLNVTITTFQPQGQKTNRNTQQHTVVKCQISIPHWNRCDVTWKFS
jgi:hypothetical protein